MAHSGFNELFWRKDRKRYVNGPVMVYWSQIAYCKLSAGLVKYQLNKKPAFPYYHLRLEIGIKIEVVLHVYK
jgi:hypothetical protein